MLQGAENTDCFCDYSLTFSNVCGKEGNHLVCSFFFSFCQSVYLRLSVRFHACMVVRAFVHVWITQAG